MRPETIALRAGYDSDPTTKAVPIYHGEGTLADVEELVAALAAATA